MEDLEEHQYFIWLFITEETQKSLFLSLICIMSIYCNILALQVKNWISILVISELFHCYPFVLHISGPYIVMEAQTGCH